MVVREGGWYCFDSALLIFMLFDVVKFGYPIPGGEVLLVICLQATLAVQVKQQTPSC